TLELFGDEVLIRKVARKPVRREQQDGFHFALRDGIAQAVERWAIKRLAADPIILIEVLGGDLIIVFGGVVLKGGDLRSDGFMLLLARARDARINGSDLH